MSKERLDRDAEKVVSVTGSTFDLAKTETLRRRDIGQIRVYMHSIKAMPKWQEGQTIKCVRCLAPEHGRCAI